MVPTPPLHAQSHHNHSFYRKPNMAATEEINLEELDRFAAELREIFNYAPEFDTIREIKNYQNQLQRNFSARKEEYQKSLKDVVASLDELKDSIASHSPMAYLEKRTQIQNEKAAVEKEIAQITAEKTRTAELIVQYKKQATVLEEQKESYEDRKNLDLPKLKHLVRLYENVSSIKWDYEKYEKEEKVAGVVYLPTDVQPFEMSKDEMTSFDMTNKLWALLEAA